jgi:hypothetical protein
MKPTLLILLAFLLSAQAPVRADDPPKTPDGTGEVRGHLKFKSLKNRKTEFEGIDVGVEGDTRKYIGGAPGSPQRAIWEFEKLPKSLTTATGDVVQLKLTCSHFYLTKPVGRAAQVVIRVVSHTCPQVQPDLQQKGEWQWVPRKVEANGKTLHEQYLDDVAAYRDKKIDLQAAKPDDEAWKAASALAEKYGYYEVRVPKFLDLVETSIDLPAGGFRNSLKNDREVGADGKPVRPLVSIYVKCETEGLLLGVKETDLYITEKVPPKK